MRNKLEYINTFSANYCSIILQINVVENKPPTVLGLLFYEIKLGLLHANNIIFTIYGI